MDKINEDFIDGLRKPELITLYNNYLHQIQCIAQSNNICETEFNFLFRNYLSQYKWYDSVPKDVGRYDKFTWQFITKLWLRRKIILWAITMLITAGLVHCQPDVSAIFMKNIQDYIYPGMSVWRKMTLPILQIFPSLSSLYDETCLVPNPFFQVADFDCSPCMHTVNIMDLSSVPEHHETNFPHIFQTNSTIFDLNTFYNVYVQNRNLFQTDAYKVQSTNGAITNLDDMFNDFLNETNQNESHNLWRCNRMGPARVLRQKIFIPNRLPSSGMSIERYIAIDTIHGPSYTIPDIDCSNVFIFQLFGTRTIRLVPTIECQYKCRTLSIRLQESQVLNYDWWYWKPISTPDKENLTPSISYIGAFC